MLSRWRVQKPYGSCTLFLLYTLDITLYAFTWLYLTLHCSSTVLLHSTWLYCLLLSLYLTLHYSTMALLHSTLLYITLQQLPFTPLESTAFYTIALRPLLDSTLPYHGSTSLYFAALLHSISLYITLPGIYFTLLCSTLIYHGSTSLYSTLHFNTLLISIWLYYILP